MIGWRPCAVVLGGTMSPPVVEIVSAKSGHYLVFGAETIILESLRGSGAFQIDLIRMAVDLIQRRGKGHTLVDVGAHIGTFSIPVSTVTGMSVVAFEAQRRMAHLLGANFELNSIAQAQVHHVALGGPDDPPSVELPCIDYARNGNFGGLSVEAELRDERSAPNLSFLDRTETVEMRTLDSFNLSDVGLVKVDVEGHELSVLQGAVETLARNGRPPILFECWSDAAFRARRDKTIAFVEALGYRCTAYVDDIVALST